MLYRAAVIGDSQTVMGFKAVGLTTVAVSEEKEAARQLHKLAEAGYAVIYITEQLAALIPQDIGRYNDEPTVAVIHPFPEGEPGDRAARASPGGGAGRGRRHPQKILTPFSGE